MWPVDVEAERKPRKELILPPPIARHGLVHQFDVVQSTGRMVVRSGSNVNIVGQLGRT